MQAKKEPRNGGGLLVTPVRAPEDDPYRYGRDAGPYTTPDEELAAELQDELGIELHAQHVRRRPAVPTRHEIMRLMENAQLRSQRDYLIMRLLYSTGMRPAELLALCFADVNFADCFIFVRDSKEGRDRYVLTDKETYRLLQEWQGERAFSERIFEIGERQLQNVIHDCAPTRMLKKYEAMGRHFYPYSLRHAFATHAYDRGMDLFALQQLMGHQFLDTTRIYVEVSMRHTTREYRKVNLFKP